jgi:aldehyde dehydrogenase (NAD+)
MHMFNNTGQSCNAPSRMFVPAARLAEAEAIAKAVTEQVVVAIPPMRGRRWVRSYPNCSSTSIQALIQAGIDEGAKLVDRRHGPSRGLEHGIFREADGVLRRSQRHDDRPRGDLRPRAGMIPYDSEEEAIAMANDTPYGLAGYVQSGDIEHARARGPTHPRRQPALNGASGGYDVPFGGFKQSGNGREWGAHGFTDYLEIKALEGFAA